MCHAPTMCTAQGQLEMLAPPQRQGGVWAAWGAQRKGDSGGGRLFRKWKALHFSFLIKKKKKRKKHPSNSSKAVSVPKRIKNILDAKQGGFFFFFFCLKWVGRNSAYFSPES